MKDLKTQLVEFAARRIVSEVVGITARNLEKQVRGEIQNRRLRNAVKSTSTPKKGTNQMARTSDTLGFSEANTRAQAANTDDRGQKGPKPHIEFWVNTVMVYADGDEPVRILTGRPLTAFNANRAVSTNNEEFNQVNVLNNSFVDMLNADSQTLNLGESKYYSPQNMEAPEGKPPYYKAGIYIQLHRSEADPALLAAEKQDAEAAETARLRKLFG